MTFQRATLKAPVQFEGLGLHGGEPVRVRVSPGSEGIRFRYAGEVVAARPENVTDTTRSTKLGPVGTVEHMMSAFAGLEITDADVELDAPEMPGMDGSATEYVRAFVEVGFEPLGEVEAQSLFARVFHKEEGIEIAISKGDGHWQYLYDTGMRWPQQQLFETEDLIGTYRSEIAPSRTFALAEEIPQIIQYGLGKGLDESSALILGIEGYKNEPRFPDEPARHKLLDLMGDLYLAGVPLRLLNVVAARSGHRANVMAAAKLAAFMSGEGS